MNILPFLDVADSMRDLVSRGLELFTDTDNGLTSIIIQLCATLILFLVVRFCLWDKVTKIIEERNQKSQEAFDALNQAKIDAVAIHDKAEEDIKQAKIEANNIIEKAKEKGNLEAEEIINKAEEEANRKLEKAKEEIESEVKKASDDIKKEIVDTAYLLAEKIINEEIDREKHEKIVSEFLNKVDENDK